MVELIDKFAERFIREIKNVLSEKRFCNVVVSGGRTPLLMYDRLQRNDVDSIDWGRVNMLVMDERLMSSSADSNLVNLKERFIYKFDIKLHRLFHFNHKCSESREALKSHKNELSLDIGFFGMGDDGHVAGVFPNHIIIEDNVKYSYSCGYGDFTRVSMSLNYLKTIKRKILIVNSTKRKAIYWNKNLRLPVHNINFDEVIFND